MTEFHSVAFSDIYVGCGGQAIGYTFRITLRQNRTMFLQFQSKCARQTWLIFSPDTDLTPNSIMRKGPSAFSLVMNL